MVAEIRDPTGDTGTGAGDTFQETQGYSTTVTAQDSVADKVITLVEETGITAEPEVHKGTMVTTPTLPPTKTGIKCGTAVRTVRKEVVQHIKNDGLGGWIKDIREAMPSRRSQ